MAEPTRSQKLRREQYKSKISISNYGKHEPKPKKIRYGIYAEKGAYHGYKKNGIWYPNG